MQTFSSATDLLYYEYHPLKTVSSDMTAVNCFLTAINTDVDVLIDFKYDSARHTFSTYLLLSRRVNCIPYLSSRSPAKTEKLARRRLGCLFTGRRENINFPINGDMKICRGWWWGWLMAV